MAQHFLLWKRKSIWLLLAAAWAIVITGLSLQSADWISYVGVLWVTFTLIGFVYGMDTLSDHHHPWEAIHSRQGIWLLPLPITGTAVSLFLGHGTILSAGFILIIGMAYTYPFKTSKGIFRIKSITGVKSILIGIGWALLIYLGLGHFSHSMANWTAAFVAIQVTIGSILRDLDDLEEDQVAAVKTVPLVLGERNSYVLLHVVNVLSGILLYFSPLPWGPWWWGVVLWRAATLEWLRLGDPGHYATQYMNLATCGWILILKLVGHAFA